MYVLRGTSVLDNALEIITKLLIFGFSQLFAHCVTIFNDLFTLKKSGLRARPSLAPEQILRLTHDPI